jgi:two-component system, NarL family, nitrate/nitrite response regulator NarL
LRVVIADDHDVVRKGVRSILESRSDVNVVGEASNGKEALQQAVELKPDLIVLDVSMPVMDGISAAKEIKKVLPATPILILSMHSGREMVRAAQSAGAQGFITKTDVAGVLLDAVDSLQKGETFFTTE